MAQKIISERFDVKDNHTFAVYSKNGGYGTLKKLFAMKPDDVIEEVK